MAILSRPNVERALYRYRVILSTGFLLLILYLAVYTWIRLPPLTMVVGWEPDTVLRVLDVVEEEYADVLQSSDVIVAIDGRRVQRGEELFPTYVQPGYHLTIEREGAIIEREVAGLRVGQVAPRGGGRTDRCGPGCGCGRAHARPRR